MTARLVRGALLVLGAYLVGAWISNRLEQPALRMLGLDHVGRPGTEHRLPLVISVVVAPQIIGAAVGGFLLGYSSQGFRLRWLGISLALLFTFALYWHSMLAGDTFAGSHGIVAPPLHTLVICVAIAGGLWVGGRLRSRVAAT